MNEKILIVDDNIDLLQSLSELLEDEGFQVRSEDSVEAALEIFTKFKPAVILTDMNMPGMTGLDLLKTVRKSDSMVQIVILTGYATVKNVAEAMSSDGAFAYLQKPVMDFEILFSTLRQAMQKYNLLHDNDEWEDRLRKANLRFDTIFENMDAIIYVADMETYELIYVNSRFKALFQYDDEGDNKNALCWQVIQKEQNGPCPFCTNSRLTDPRGCPLQPYTWEFYNPVVKRHFSIKDQAIQWHDGRIVKLHIAMDMTKYRKLTHEMQQAKRFKAIGVLAGGIAHDLNNTLASVLANLNVAEMLVSDSQAGEFFTAAEEGIMQAKALSGKLLGLARGDEPVKQRLDMLFFIKEFIEKTECRSAINFQISDKHGEYPLDADADQIKTVFYNIALNAAEAMDFKGEIEVFLDRRYSTTRGCEYVIISFSDNGRGISASDIEKVFDPYYTTKFPGSDKGTGLGLSIAYSIVRKHDGFIDIDSAEGRGTRVDIQLPVAGNLCTPDDIGE
ncbi:MAG: response regulator [Desulfamplus sp.]|nr:response regulator [Desulfamplus sp.]